MKHETATEPLRFETFEAYLDWEVQQPIRYELHNGAVVALAGASELHNAMDDGRFVLVAAQNERIEITCENLTLTFDDIYAGTTLDTGPA